MLVLKSNTPVSFDIDYNITTEDSKGLADISTAKFFLATAPGEADSKYFLKTYGSGLSYNDGNGLWTVTVDQGDLENVNSDITYKGILAIQYTGDTDYREPDLFEGTERLEIKIDPNWAE